MRKTLFFALLMYSFPAFGQRPCFENKEHPLPPLSGETKKVYESKLAEAKTIYEKDSSDADAIIWLGRRMAYLGEYQKAITIFTRGILLFPNDARMYRHRGHRYITLRCFDKAIEDLKKAASLTEGKPDETEPDGLPNAQNIPVSTLQTNIWYHLGLAYFLKYDYLKAETAFEKGLAVSKNDDMYVAMANWLHKTLLNIGKKQEADSVLNSLSTSLNPIENKDYITILYFFRHSPAANEIDRYMDAVISRITKDTLNVQAATLYFGAGFYCLHKKMPEKGKQFFEKAIATGQWAAFGYIAAEAELFLDTVF